jgi:hypothetical protein
MCGLNVLIRCIETMMNLLQRRIWELVDRHISMRATARVLKVDHAYLSRLATGEKDNPSDALLRKLGIRRIVTYEYL